MAINGRLQILAAVEETLDTPNNRSGSIFDRLTLGYNFTDGVAAGQNDLGWSGRFTIAAGNTAVIDFAALQVDLGGGGGFVAQTDAFGAAITFVEVTGIIIGNRETVAGTRTLQFGPNNGATPFLFLFVDQTDLVSLVPGGAYCMWSDEAQTVGAGASDMMRLINTDGANGVAFDILIVGRTA